MGDPTAAARAVRAERRRRNRGLLESDPGAFRLATLPPVMATPPVVSAAVDSGNPMAVSAVTAGSAISGSVAIPWTDPRFRYLGGAAVVAGVSFPFTILARYNQITSNANPANMHVSWMHDGTELELCLYQQVGFRYRLLIDGQPHSATAETITGTNGHLFLVKVTFASRATRKIELQGYTTYFGGVRIGPNDSLWTPNTYIGPRVLLLGDSFVEGTGTTINLMGLGNQAARLLGWRDAWNSGVGGTGYTTDAGTPGKTTFRGRVQADVIARNPDIVIVAGGLNDHSVGATGAQVQTEAGLLFDAILAGLPQVTLIATGPWNNSGNVPTARFVDIRDGIHNALVASGGHCFIDNVGGPEPENANVNLYVNQGWITGTGHVGATTGSGNADLYTGPDGVHPTQAGHDYFGHRLASDIASWIRAGAPTGAKVLHGVVTA
jgi:lysophospholipase L1-like esterase